MCPASSPTARAGWIIALAAAMAALPASGCAPKVAPEPIGHYLKSPAELQRVGRVVFVGLTSDGRHPDIARQMSEALFQAIQEKRMFHIDVVARSDSLCQDLALDGRSALKLQDLADMREAFKCDAILLGRIDQFQPYPRMKIALYLQLFDLKQGTLLWGVDHIWDTTEKRTEERVKKFFRRQMRSGYDPVDWQLAMVSPSVFMKFVAHETAGTLAPATAEAKAK